jgi:hypothetical protein
MKDTIRERIIELLPAAKGSVSEVRKPCTRPGCRACASGRRHPAFIYVFADENGRRRCLHVPRQLAAPLQRMIRSGRLIDRLLFREGEAFVRSRGGERS